MNALRGLVCLSSLAAAVILAPTDARACGGCFHPAAEVGSSVITDHRMVFKVSTRETILWDQVRYTGDPKEFAWVLPVRDGARIELSRDEWIAALDASTRTTVSGPERFCGGGGGGGGGGGCGAMSDTTATSARGGDSFSGSSDAGFSGNGDVQVLSQSVIGPYQAVTIRASTGQGISEWLTTNGFAIPDEVKPTVDAYTRERFDFIALRLRPGQGVQAMRPVRVVTQGADATLPLRMVAAGIGAKVGLTLWVIGEGRYHTQNFPDGVIDYDKLTWDGRASKSNLSDMQREALASNGGRSWITEAAVHVNATVNKPFANGTLPNPPLTLAYRSQCITRPAQTVKCSEDELPPPNGSPDDPGDPPLDDAGVDAGTDADVDADVDASTSTDAGTRVDAGSTSCTKVVSGCDGFDDLDVATRDLHASDVWVTRLRADLPVSALATDLVLEAAPEQKEVDPQHHTEKFSDPTFDPCASTRAASSDDDGGGACACRSTAPVRSNLGTWTLIAATGYVASRVVRRRRR